MSQIGNFNPGGSGAGAVLTLTGNTGGAVGPNSGNINIVGTGGITVAGNPGTSTLTISDNGYAYTAVSTTPYTATATDVYLSVDTSSLAITIHLPNVPTLGRIFIIKDRTGNAINNNITVTTAGGATLFDGSTSVIANNNYQAIQLIGNGTSYEIY